MGVPHPCNYGFRVGFIPFMCAHLGYFIQKGVEARGASSMEGSSEFDLRGSSRLSYLCQASLSAYTITVDMSANP